MMDVYRRASGAAQDVAALPPKYLNMYGDFVTKNASAVGQIEGALRSLTYIIPGKPWSCAAFSASILTYNRAI